MNQNTKYCTQKFFFFFRLLHTSTSKVTNKEKTCFVFGWKFQFLVIFTRSKGKKQYANPVPLKVLARYVKVHNKTRTSSYQKVKNIWKQRLHSIRALNPRPEENLQLYKKLAKKRFLNSSF